jgi:hypothetical protein
VRHCCSASPFCALVPSKVAWITKAGTFSGAPGQLFWSYWLHPLESLPQNRIRIAPGQRHAALAAVSTSDIGINSGWIGWWKPECTGFASTAAVFTPAAGLPRRC